MDKHKKKQGKRIKSISYLRGAAINSHDYSNDARRRDELNKNYSKHLGTDSIHIDDEIEDAALQAYEAYWLDYRAREKRKEARRIKQSLSLDAIYSSSSHNDVIKYKEKLGDNLNINEVDFKIRRLLGRGFGYPKIKAKQVLKIASALLLILSANEALAFDLNAAAKAGLKLAYDSSEAWVPFAIGLFGIGGLLIGEGDLRVRGWNAAKGVVLGIIVLTGILEGVGKIV